jgi:hypothetical protein
MLSDNLHILIQLLIGITVFLYLGNVITLLPMALVEQFLQSVRSGFEQGTEQIVLGGIIMV